MGAYYEPSFVISFAMTEFLIEIGELLGRLEDGDIYFFSKERYFESSARSIHATLSLGHDPLDLGQVRDILQDKLLLAPPHHVRRIKNAFRAYLTMEGFDPYSFADLLQAQRLMTGGLYSDGALYRETAEEGKKEHMERLLKELILWLRESPLHPLIKSCVFHYGFEYIRPFRHGNGRVVRLWHSLMLRRWRMLFSYVPLEVILYERRRNYYEALQRSNDSGDITEFVEFMLRLIRDSLLELQKYHEGFRDRERLAKGSSSAGEGLSESRFSAAGITKIRVPLTERILIVLRENPYLTARDIAAHYQVSQRQVERIFSRLKEEGRIKRQGANKNGFWMVIDL